MDGPDERKLSLFVRVGHIEEVDKNQEEEENANIEDNHVDVPAQLFKPVNNPKRAEDFRQILHNDLGFPSTPKLVK